MTATAMTRDQALDELDVLTTAAHALIVEYRTLWCAFGGGLEEAEGGTAGDVGREAATAAGSLALTQMFRLKTLNEHLVEAGRSPQLGRAEAIASPSVAEVALAPPGAAELACFPAREKAIARALDERHAALALALATPALSEDPVLQNVRATLEGGPAHVSGVDDLLAALDATAPASLVIVSGRMPADAFEERLLAVSDAVYRQVVSALGAQFGQTDPFAAGGFRNLATEAMSALEDVHVLLLLRGLLPPFTL